MSPALAVSGLTKSFAGVQAVRDLSFTVPQGVTAQTYWWQLALANSQTFTRRIVLNGRGI